MRLVKNFTKHKELLLDDNLDRDPQLIIASSMQ